MADQTRMMMMGYDDWIIEKSIVMYRPIDWKTVMLSRKRMMTSIAETEKAAWMYCMKIILASALMCRLPGPMYVDCEAPAACMEASQPSSHTSSRITSAGAISSSVEASSTFHTSEKYSE